jgi:hypothetical protein
MPTPQTAKRPATEKRDELARRNEKRATPEIACDADGGGG